MTSRAAGNIRGNDKGAAGEKVRMDEAGIPTAGRVQVQDMGRDVVQHSAEFFSAIETTAIGANAQPSKRKGVNEERKNY